MEGYRGKTVRMEDGSVFKIFRHMHVETEDRIARGSIFIVRFKFKRFGHSVNMQLSKIPVLLIAGFPGFRDKIWMIDWETGYWQGVYQFENAEAIENYKKSFILARMNKRAVSNTISYRILPGKKIHDYFSGAVVD
ncbi:MAG: YdhR family protein [Calditrichia bacterium]